jgi:hypothetical protein
MIDEDTVSVGVTERLLGTKIWLRVPVFFDEAESWQKNEPSSSGTSYSIAEKAAVYPHD